MQHRDLRLSDDARDLPLLIQYADEAMYAAKSRGRGYDPQLRRYKDRLGQDARAKPAAVFAPSS